MHIHFNSRKSSSIRTAHATAVGVGQTPHTGSNAGYDIARSPNWRDLPRHNDRKPYTGRPYPLAPDSNHFFTVCRVLRSRHVTE